MDAGAGEVLPPGWAWAKLSEIVAAPETVSPAAAFKGRSTFSYVSLTSVEPGRIVAPEEIPPASAPSRARQQIRQGDTLFSCVRVYLEKIVCVPPDLDGEVCSTAFAVLRPRAGIDPGYLYWLTRQPQFILEAEARQKGNSPPAVQDADLRDITVPVAPSAEQARIVAAVNVLFEELEAGEAALARARESLAQFRANLLHAACTGALTADWRAANPVDSSAKELLALIAEERTSKVAKRHREAAPPDGPPPSDLPRSWGWATMDQVCWQIDYGSSARCRPMADGVPVLRMGNIQAGRLDYTDLKHLPLDHEEFPDLLLEPGDLLFNRTNSAELVGKTAVFEGHHRPVSFASYIVRAKAVRVRPQFLAHYINSPLGRQWIASVMTQQVGQANVSGGRLRTLCIPVPPLPEQDEIVARLADSFDVARDAALGQSGVEQAAQLRQSILHAAFTGRLVPQNSEDEPASALLARLRASPVATRAPRKRRIAAQPDLIETTP